MSQKYLRNRPFLVINIISRPRKGVNTTTKGWGDIDGNWDHFEQPSVVDRVNDSHLLNSSIIIDINNSKLIKSPFEAAIENEVVYRYLERYSSQVNEAVQIWEQQETKRQADIKAKKENSEVITLRYNQE